MQKGFTLIELLVVIAIIGILASIVLVSFPGATDKARDSRAVSAIGQMRTVMTYINANTGDYDDFVCTVTEATETCACTESDLDPLCEEVYNNVGWTTANMVIIECNDCSASGLPAACVYVNLNSDDPEWYCADSTGIAGFVDAADPDPSTTCNYTAGAGTAVCPAETSG